MIDFARVQASDYDALSDFLAGFENETRPKSYWLERFQLWWERNPALTEDLPRGWVLKDDSRIVGFLGGIPLEYQVRGEPVRICGATTWRVHADYRLASIKLILEQMEAWKDSLLFFSTPSDKVRDILTRLSFTAMPAGTSGRMSIVINRRFVNPLLSFFLNRSAHANVRDVSKADSAFDELWARTRNLHPTTCVRDARMLNWFCFAGGASHRKKLFGYYEDGKLLGYTVFYRRPSPGRSVFEQLDLWIDPPSGPRHDAIATALLAKAKAHAESERYGYLLLRHFTEEYRSLLLRRGVWVAKRENWTHFFRSPSREVPRSETRLSCIEGDFAL